MSWSKEELLFWGSRENTPPLTSSISIAWPNGAEPNIYWVTAWINRPCHWLLSGGFGEHTPSAPGQGLCKARKRCREALRLWSWGAELACCSSTAEIRPLWTSTSPPVKWGVMIISDGALNVWNRESTQKHYCLLFCFVFPASLFESHNPKFCSIQLISVERKEMEKPRAHACLCGHQFPVGLCWTHVSNPGWRQLWTRPRDKAKGAPVTWMPSDADRTTRKNEGMFYMVSVFPWWLLGGFLGRFDPGIFQK